MRHITLFVSCSSDLPLSYRMKTEKISNLGEKTVSQKKLSGKTMEE
jgi:hypothetical protein